MKNEHKRYTIEPGCTVLHVLYVLGELPVSCGSKQINQTESVGSQGLQSIAKYRFSKYHSESIKYQLNISTDTVCNESYLDLGCW